MVELNRGIKRGRAPRATEGVIAAKKIDARVAAILARLPKQGYHRRIELAVSAGLRKSVSVAAATDSTERGAEFISWWSKNAKKLAFIGGI